MNIDDSGVLGSDLGDFGDLGEGQFDAAPATPEPQMQAGPAPAMPSYAPGGGGGNAVHIGDDGGVADLVNRARGRSDGFLLDDLRAITDRPNWQAHESKQLYQFATVNNVPGSAEELGQGWGKHGTQLQQISEDLYSAISELSNAWIGQAAGAAQGALVGIANSSSQAAEAARAMGSRLSQQASAAAELKKMPQPEEFDPAQETANMLAMGPAAMVKDMKEKFDQARAVKAQQVQYLETYTAAMSEVDGSTPSFGPASLGLKQVTNSGGTNLSSVGGVGGPGVAGGAQGHGVDALAGGHGAPAHGGAAQHQPQQQAPQTPQQPAAQAPAGGGASSAGAAMPQAPAASSSGFGAGAAALGGALAGGGAAVAGARALSKGSKTKATEASDGNSTEAAAQQTAQPASSVQQPQSAGIAGANGVIGGREAAGMAPAATPMGGGMGAAGAAAGTGQEEEEHKHASFLIEADPDDVFGANQATAPPVLGAWGPDDEE
ncbi:hypothetical protein [Prauserella rugosa]|uniref:PPE family protein n=1 Tax=Prauserella rugosa TaxID=43354 RepID=A0A660CHW9_9PSEU|nr:hypothetical protein [Prauserella rugosa]TWH21159.1 hypothetical protein JD82_03013 [Prauserella rugosa]